MTTRTALVLVLMFAAISAGAQVQWTTIGNLAKARGNFCAADIGNGQVLVIGGYTHTNGGDQPTASCEIVDVTSRSILPAPSMHLPRAYFVTLYTPDSNLVAIGGDMSGALNSGDVTPNVELYDRASKSWRSLGDLRVGRFEHMAAFINDHEILVVGGRRADLGVIPNAEIFDIRNGASRVAASFPAPVSSAMMGRASNGDIVLYGYRTGGANSDRSPFVYRYDTAGDRWDTISRLNKASQQPLMLTLWDGRLMVIGGAMSEDPFVLDPTIYTDAPSGWHALGSLGTPRIWCSAAQWSYDSVLVIGGYNQLSAAGLAGTEWVNLATGAVSPGPRMGAARAFSAAVSVPLRWGETLPLSSAIVAIAGVDGWSNYIGAVEVLGPQCSAQIGPDMTITQGESAQLWASGPAGSTYQWVPPIGLSCTDCPNPIATPSASTSYLVTVTTPEGCVITDTVSVNVKVRAGVNTSDAADAGAIAAFAPSGSDASVIPITLRSAARVTLEAFDRIGRRVGRIIDGPMEAGLHVLPWDHASLSSGIYFLRLTADGTMVNRSVAVTR